MTTLTDDDLRALLEQEAQAYDVPEHGPAEVVAALDEVTPRRPLRHRGWAQLAAAGVVTVAVLAGVSVLDRGGEPATDAMARRSAGELAGGGSGAGTTGVEGYASEAQSTEQAPAALDSDRAARDMVGTDGSVAAPQPAPAIAGTAGVAAGSAGTGQESASGGKGAAPNGAVGAPAPDGAESRVVKTGSIALVAEDGRVSAILSAVQRAATAHGGYIASSSSNEYGESPSGEVSIRVPVARFEDLVGAVRGLDAEVRTATTTGKDVTAQYADIEAQLRTLRATRERFLTILARASTISEILSVQQRVDGVTGQIDRLEGSRKLLASQTELSTLTVSVSEDDDPAVRVEERRSGLAEALSDAKDGFVTGVEAIVRHSGRALLWLLCLSGLLVAGRAAWKVARRRLV